jgi:Flp pilus assembly protein TadD
MARPMSDALYIELRKTARHDLARVVSVARELRDAERIDAAAMDAIVAAVATLVTPLFGLDAAETYAMVREMLP